MKSYSATYLKALKDAISAAFWYKGELREFLEASLGDPSILDELDWETKEVSKRDLVARCLEMLWEEDESYYAEDVDCLTRGILEIQRYRSLEQLEDGEARVARAKLAKEALRSCYVEHQRHSTADYDYIKAELERREREDADRSRRRAAEDELRTRDPNTYYGRILGLKGKVTKAHIRERYKELLKTYHPDMFSALGEDFVELATARTQRINEAYQYMAERYKLE